MNRVGLGLAVGAGYVLGRTKKMKLAFAVGSLVAGKRMHLSPRALADLVSQQLQNNPQFKEIGDQLREDLRGVGKAASGAMVERQIDALADRLHGRTAEVRDQLSGVSGRAKGLLEDEEEDEAQEEDENEESGEAEGEDSRDEYEDEEPAGETEDEEPEGKEEPSDDEAEGGPVRKSAKKAAKKAPAKKTAAKRAPAKKAPAKKAASKQTTAKKSAAKRTAARKTASARSGSGDTRARRSKGGGER
ncbi:DNA primase [Streptomyces sp. NPDC001137]|uniref:DNA primase n=1 Tax=Streptomyces sp. NPDC001137 TaxID=3154378 RepID=UPI00332AD313